MYPGFLAVFLNGWQGRPCREIPSSTPRSEVFPSGFYFFRSDFGKTGNALRRVEWPVDPFQKREDLPGTYTDRVESEDGLRKFWRGPLPVGEDPGMKIVFPYTGDF